MKRLIFFTILFASSLPIALFAQEARKISWRKTDDHWVRKNSVTFSATTFGHSRYNGMGMPQYNLEYDRHLPYNLSVGAIGLYAPLKWDAATDTYTMRESFWFAGAKVNYNLPVVRNWLYFRVGVGAGVGYHKVRGFDMGWPQTPPVSAPPAEDRVKPHFIVDAYWVFRAAKWLELRFAPGIISPSQFIVGSKLDAPYNDSVYYYWNMLGTLGVSVRF